MKILVIGNGGREHALVWKLAQSPRVEKLYCTPGNAGTAHHAENVAIAADDVDGLLAFAWKHKINLTVVGPEVPLVAGIVDVFEAHGLPVFGPSKAAAQLEGSKIFSKNLMQKYKIPTADFAVFQDAAEARRYVHHLSFPVVIKADGLAAGKGVVIAQSLEEAEATIDQTMRHKVFGDAGNAIVIEAFLQGEEASLLAFTDGKTILPMAGAQDHKAVFDGDNGPNTGGMGAYSPAPALTDSLVETVLQTILLPTLDALRQEGIVYKGVLYAGLMLTQDGPKVIEFNCRFGDPETQVVLPRMENDLVDVLLAVVNDTLDTIQLRWTPEHCLSVVLASGGYPGVYQKGKVITGLDSVKKAVVFHAGTAQQGNDIVTAGGRVLNVTALGETIHAAFDNAYSALRGVHFEGMIYRTDIGWRAKRREK